ncbi:hypothetical protein FRC02_006179 [Tulasnella sp. 418]|nr:hypothetical protein FRC02_006179 [Tulasnella sp. 418]
MSGEFTDSLRHRSARVKVPLCTLASMPSIADESWLQTPPRPRSVSDVLEIPDETLFGPGSTPLRPRTRGIDPCTPKKTKVQRQLDLVQNWVDHHPVPVAHLVKPRVLDWLRDQATTGVHVPTAEKVEQLAARAYPAAYRIDLDRIEDDDWDEFLGFWRCMKDFTFWNTTLFHADNPIDYNVVDLDIPGQPIVSGFENLCSEIFDPVAVETGPWSFIKEAEEEETAPNERRPSMITRCLDRIKCTDAKKAKKTSKLVQKLKSLGKKLF